MVFRRNAFSDSCRHFAGSRAQRHDRYSRSRREATAFAEVDDRLPRACGRFIRRDLPRRCHHRRTGDSAERDNQIAAGECQSLPRPKRNRYQLFRSRKSGKPDRSRRCIGNSGLGDATQPSQSGRTGLKRRRDRQPDLQIAARHREPAQPSSSTGSARRWSAGSSRR